MDLENLGGRLISIWKEGAKLVIAARREDRLKALAQSLPDAETTSKDPQIQEWLKNTARTEGMGLRSSDIADAVAYAINTSDTVAVNEILIRPTKQAV